MKYLKKFKLFEAVIIPDKIKEVRKLLSFDDLVEYGVVNGFDVVEYNEFFETLSDNNKKTAPPKGAIPFFALFNPLRKKAMFVVNAPTDIVRRIPNFKEIVDDIIGHERIHGEQNIRRKELTFDLPNPTERKKYFSNSDEIMAFAWSIANGLAKKNSTIQGAFQDLNNNKWGREEHFNLWNSIKDVCDDKIIKKYRKYIYLYLNKMIKPDSESNIISNKYSKKSTSELKSLLRHFVNNEEYEKASTIRDEINQRK